MKQINISGVLIVVPVFMALGSVYFKSIWLVVATVFSIFITVAVLPFCHKRENLWLFILYGICAIPINIFFLMKYPELKDLICNLDTDITDCLSLLQFILIATGVEEVVISLIGRKLWKRQYALYIP